MRSEEIHILLKAASEMNRSISEQFSLQGHTLTGAAERSLQASVTRTKGRTTVTGVAVDYMLKLDDFTTPEEVRSENKNEALDGLTRYVELRMGIYGSAARSVAYRILQKHRSEGRPLPSSAAFSQTGKRTGFIEDAETSPQNSTDRIVSDGLDQMMESVFSKQQNEIV